MKNSTPQSDPRQNNCRNTTSPTITPPTREWTTANCRGTLTMHIAVAVLCDWGRHTQKPRSLSRSGFSLSPRRSTLSKPPRRFGDDDDLYRLTSIFLHFSVIAYSLNTTLDNNSRREARSWKLNEITSTLPALRPPGSDRRETRPGQRLLAAPHGDQELGHFLRSMIAPGSGLLRFGNCRIFDSGTAGLEALS